MFHTNVKNDIYMFLYPYEHICLLKQDCKKKKKTNTVYNFVVSRVCCIPCTVLYRIYVQNNRKSISYSNCCWLY